MERVRRRPWPNKIDTLRHSIAKITMNSNNKYMLVLLGAIVAMAFFASCQEHGSTTTGSPVTANSNNNNNTTPLRPKVWCRGLGRHRPRRRKVLLAVAEPKAFKIVLL